MMMMMMMMMMINYFCGMVDRRKTFSLITSRDHCQRSSPFPICDTPRAGFESAQNLSSGLFEWSCAVLIITTPGRHSWLNVWMMHRLIAYRIKQSIQHFLKQKTTRFQTKESMHNFVITKKIVYFCQKKIIWQILRQKKIKNQENVDQEKSKIMFSVPQPPPPEPRKVQNFWLNYYQITIPHHWQTYTPTYYPQTSSHP